VLLHQALFFISSIVKLGIRQFPKNLGMKESSHLCDTKRVEDEKKFLLECSSCTQIRSQFENTTNLHDLLNQQSHHLNPYSDYDDMLSI
jgi:hypothetical protein